MFSVESQLLLCVLLSSDGVDKRGRRVQQTSAEDLRRYYDLHDDTATAPPEGASDSDGDSDSSTDVEEVTALQKPEVGVACCKWVWPL